MQSRLAISTSDRRVGIVSLFVNRCYLGFRFLFGYA